MKITIATCLLKKKNLRKIKKETWPEVMTDNQAEIKEIKTL